MHRCVGKQTPAVENKENMLNTSRIIGGGKQPAHREQESLCKGEHPRNRCTHHIAPRTVVTLNDAAGLLPVLQTWVVPPSLHPRAPSRGGAKW